MSGANCQRQYFSSHMYIWIITALLQAPDVAVPVPGKQRGTRMRILISTFGSRGDVQPMAGLATALRSLGSEAVVAAPPDPANEQLLARLDVPFAPTFMSVQQWMSQMRERCAGARF